MSSHARGARESEGRRKFFPSHRADMSLARKLSRRSLRLVPSILSKALKSQLAGLNERNGLQN